MKKTISLFLILLIAAMLLGAAPAAFAADWADAYAQILQTKAGTGTEISYVLYDIDKDGTPELIVKSGSYEAEFMGEVYTCAGGAAVKVGEFGLSHTALFTDPGENGILLWQAHMGVASGCRCRLVDGALVSEQLFDETLDIQNNPDADYTPVEVYVPGAKYLQLYDASSNPQAAYDETLNTLASETKLLSVQDAQEQLGLLYSAAASLRQDDAGKTWKYTVTDLDRNGRLELLAASEHDQSRSTTLAAWEVGPDLNSLEACNINLSEDESFPDIISESADTFYEEGSDTWHYLFYDNMILSDSEAYAAKCSVSLRNGVFSYEQFALRHVITVGGQTDVSYTDNAGFPSSPGDYNSAGTDAFAGRRRSSSNFDWFVFDEITLSRLTDAYAVFCGEKAVSASAQASQAMQPSPQPVPTPQPQPVPDFLMITKNPTNEYHNEGETAWFVATANVWTSMEWTFVGPNGVEYSAGDMGYYFPRCSVDGADGPSLSISNVTDALDGFGAYCTFWYYGQTARTSTAYLYVSSEPQPTPPTPVPPVPYGNTSGTVINAAMSTVDIRLDDGTVVEVLTDICNIDGDLEIGCRCDVYYEGYEVSSDTITYVYIYGTQPGPSYGSMGGMITEAAMSTVDIRLDDGTEVEVLTDIVNVVSGSLSIGCDCTVYYYGSSPTSDNITSVDVYGWDTGEDPVENYDEDPDGDYWEDPVEDYDEDPDGDYGNPPLLL